MCCYHFFFNFFTCCYELVRVLPLITRKKSKVKRKAYDLNIIKNK